jgi:hypothetical protein
VVNERLDFVCWPRLGFVYLEMNVKQRHVGTKNLAKVHVCKNTTN